jgi:hypothetical protein
MTGLAGNDLHMPGREGMFIFGRILVLAFVMTVLAGIHGMVQVASYGLLDRIPFGKIMIFIARMAGDASEALGVVDIRLWAPLTASPFSVGDRMTRPTILIRGFSLNLNVKIFKVGHFFLSVIHGDLIYL